MFRGQKVHTHLRESAQKVKEAMVAQCGPAGQDEIEYVSSRREGEGTYFYSPSPEGQKEEDKICFVIHRGARHESLFAVYFSSEVESL